jgi:hypothetical protein
MMTGITTVEDKTLIQAVRRFFERPDVSGNLKLLRTRLPGSAEIFVAGGAVRDILIGVLHGSAPAPRDIDIFIGGLDRGFSLPGALRDQRVEPTDLKGMRWHPALSGLPYDLCLLPDFLMIDIFHREPTVEKLLAGIDFTINAIIYDYRRQMLIEKGCTAAVSAKVIDFNCDLMPDKGLIAYRILRMSHRTGFSLALPVFNFVRKRLELETLTYLKGLLRAKLGKAAATAILADYDRLCRYASHEAYLADRNRGSGP